MGSVGALSRSAVAGLLAGLGLGGAVARLLVGSAIAGLGLGSAVARLLAGLSREGLVRVIALDGRSVRSLGLVLLAADDEEGDQAADQCQGADSDDDPDPHGDGAVSALHGVGLDVGKGDLVAVDLAAVGLCDLSREGDGLGDVELVHGTDCLVGADLDDVLAALMLNCAVAVLDGSGAFNRADSRVAILLERGLGVLGVLAELRLREIVDFTVVFAEDAETAVVGHHRFHGVGVVGLDDDVGGDLQTGV